MSPRWKSAATSAALSALFFVVYPSCNWIASLRPHVGSLYFAWERSIPFLPVFIIPYMSIDLFFVASPFVTRSDEERRTLSRRITAALLIAGICFLLFPLRFAFARPHVDGPLGVIFNNFRAFDQPFNQCPSLHIALCAILADTFLRATKGPLRWALAIWFALIFISPLVTYQHHVVDILGGSALAVICFHFFRNQTLLQPFKPNFRVGAYYAAGALILSLMSLTWTPWTFLLIWPAASLALVGAGYLFVGPGIFRKENGTLPRTSLMLFAPVLVGQRLSRMHYSRRCNAYDRLTLNVWIGRCLSGAEARGIRAAGITAVVDLTAEFSESSELRALPYLQIPVLDLTAPTPQQIDQAVAFISHHENNGIVYVHCKIGYSRTAAIAGAYLLASGQVDSVEQAVAALRQARPSIVTRPETLAALGAHHARLNNRIHSAVQA
jgi:predicted protein tyrosine phosphatase